MTRPVRDILGEAIRRERLGLIRPLWADCLEDLREAYRRRADFILRLLSSDGVTLDGAGAAGRSAPSEQSPVIWEHPLPGGKQMRMVRMAKGGEWDILTRDNAGKEETEQRFSLADAYRNSGLVLAGDPSAAKIPGLGRMLAAALEIHRLNAAGMGNGVSP